MKLNWKQVAVSLIIGFVLGLACGRWMGLQVFRCRWGGPERSQQHLLHVFNKQLHLTTNQQQRVAAILEEKRKKIDALRAELRPRFEEVRESTRTEIRQLLTADQQQAFDALNAKWDARTKRFRDRWMGAGGK